LREKKNSHATPQSPRRKNILKIQRSDLCARKKNNHAAAQRSQWKIREIALVAKNIVVWSKRLSINDINYFS